MTRRSLLIPWLVASLASLSARADDARPPRATPDDPRDLASLTACARSAPYVATWDNEQPLAWHCGHVDGRPPPDLARLLDAAILDPSTIPHVRALFADGVAKHRRANVFALVGDSMTLEPQLLTAFGAGPPLPVVLSAPVRDALLVDERTTVIDFFRGAHAYGALDSFRAPRVAKNGARATWPLERERDAAESPLDAMVRTLSPAYAVVLFGTNDADLLIEPLDRIAARFAASLHALAAALEARGIIPILSTVPKHMRAPSLPDCDPRPDGRSNARIMVQATIASDVVTAVAHERHLPLIDLRAALEPLINHGIATDGVHPTFYPKRLGGGGVLDEHGLACGTNARALVTLRMLALLRKAIEAP